MSFTFEAILYKQICFSQLLKQLIIDSFKTIDVVIIKFAVLVGLKEAFSC